MVVLVWGFIKSIQLRTWFTIITYLFTIGVTVAICRDCRGCSPGTVTKHVSDTTRDTVRTPAEHDTIYRTSWKHDTAWRKDSTRKPVLSIALCDSFDTVARFGTRVTVKQCYKPIVPDSIIRAMLYPPIIGIQEPPRITTTIRDTLTITKQKAAKAWSVGPSLGIGITLDGQVKGFAGITVTRGIIHF